MPRPKPACGSLTERLDRLRHKAGLARNGENPLLHAAEALNLAALIASDCAMPQLARDLCWRQIYHFTTGPGPYDRTTTTLALQPLINLARLHTRDGDATTTYHLYQALLHATRSRSGLVIDGHTVPLSALVADSDDHSAIVQWVWTILLGSGLRALSQTGRWADVYHHALRHNGVGRRLLDGRQIAVLHHATTDQPAKATTLVDRSDTSEPWELAVAACLRTITRTLAGDTDDNEPSAMIDAYLAVESVHASVPRTFRLHLGLIVAELLRITGQSSHAAIVISDQLLDDALRDAYLARDVLAAPAGLTLTRNRQSQLHATIRRSNFGTPLTPGNLKILLKATHQCETALATQLHRLQPSALPPGGRQRGDSSGSGSGQARRVTETVTPREVEAPPEKTPRMGGTSL
ncbi:hypothetical protein [Frankia sp. AiPa1]|uniref:hypothetical protein n=1 Tax=Frankia sp. AiPa1 TaxID=573492 RepID=UPI00202ACD9C|nr:hypothetical protein [Frankia sp. AiPa1]MCL9762777.1 hypothetical protein [Frankia sp. AiPa1]